MKKININPLFLLGVNSLKPYYILSKFVLWSVKLDGGTDLKKVYSTLIENLYEKRN